MAYSKASIDPQPDSPGPEWRDLVALVQAEGIAVGECVGAHVAKIGDV